MGIVIAVVISLSAQRAWWVVVLLVVVGGVLGGLFLRGVFWFLRNE
jgi:hypothetical protein